MTGEQTTMSDNQTLYAACLEEGSHAQTDAFAYLWRYLYSLAYSMLSSRPGGEALAADCAQLALIKVHRNLSQCQEPARFRSWAAQVLRRTVIDELRRPDQARRAPLPDEGHQALRILPDEQLSSASDLQELLREALNSAAISDRSRRVIVGRYFDERPDEMLAQLESELSGSPVKPSQLQVTRAKNLAKLRSDTALVERLRDLVGE